MSYGACERQNSSFLDFYRTSAKKANTLGITWLAASGDEGAATCDWDQSIAVNGLTVTFPASIPEVTAVGGTEFNEENGAYWNLSNGVNQGSANSYIPEKAWNDNSPDLVAASGGGSNAYFPKPAWQSGPVTPDDGSRDVPDVSLAASWDHDGYLVCGQRPGGCPSLNALEAWGGTSASTPVLAGMLALVTQYLISTKAQATPGLGNINPTLYWLAQNNPAPFHDITVGDNIVPCQIGTRNCTTGSFGYKATAGYDRATGLGSVDAYKLATAWAALPTPHIASISPSALTASLQGQTLTVSGGGFQSGLTVTAFSPNNAGTSTLQGEVQIQNVSSATFQMVIAFGGPGTWGIQVNNPDGRTSNVFGLTVSPSSTAPKQKLLLSNTSFNFMARPGTSPATRSLTISSSGDPLNPLSWMAAANTTSGGNWLRLSAASGATPSTINLAINSAGLADGVYQGTITVSAPDSSNNPQTVNVALTLSAPLLALRPTALLFTASSGKNPDSQTLEIQNAGCCVLIWTAVAATQSGGNWLAVDQPSGVAPSTAVIMVDSSKLAPGVYKGTITVASGFDLSTINSPQVVAVSLAVDVPAIAPNGVVNAASFSKEAVVVPGSIVSLFGTNLASATATATATSALTTLASGTTEPRAAALPTALANTQVLVNGIPAALFYVSPTQINFQMPPGLSGSSVQVVVVSNGIQGLTADVKIEPALPGIFTASPGGTGQGAVLNEDFSPNSAQNAAVVGSAIQIFATGLGDTDPPAFAGQLAGDSPLVLTVMKPTVLIGGLPAELLFSGLAPGFVGLYQVNARIPAGGAPGSAVTLQIQMGARSSNTVTIGVR